MEIPGIGLRIRTLREEKGLTQQDLGNILSVNKSAISHYERDKRNIPIDTLIKISNFFDVDIKYILGINNEGISDDKKIRMSNEEIDFILEMRKKSNYNNLIINPRKYAKLIELKTIDYNSKI